MARAPRKRLAFDPAPTSSRAQLPSIDFNTGGGEALRALGTIFGRVNDIAQGRIEEDALRLAQAEGQRMVEETGKFAPENRSGSYWRAYNQSGIEAFGLELERQARNKAAEIYTRNRLDPKQMATEYDSYFGGVAAELPLSMRAQYRRDIEVLSRPYITKAQADLIERAEKSAAGRLAAVNQQLQAGARQMGAIAGSADITTEAGRQQLVAAGRHLSASYDRIGQHYLGAVAAGLITPGQAIDGMESDSRALVANMVEGAFFGARDKTAFAMQAMSGNLQVPVPVIDEKTGQIVLKPDGSPVVRNADPFIFMDKDAADDLRQTMSAHVNAIESNRDRLRSRYLQDAELFSRRALSEFMADPNPDALQAFIDDPRVDGRDKDYARKAYQSMGSTRTDYQAKGRMEAQIDAAPGSVSPAMIRFGPFAKDDQDELMKRLANRQDENHFANKAPFTDALTTVDRRIGQIASNVVLALNGTQAEVTQQRVAAAAVMKDVLYGETRKALEQGMVIGSNRGGAVVERLADGTQRFDPQNWLNAELEEISTETSGLTERAVELRREQREKQAEAVRLEREGDNVGAQALYDEITQRIVPELRRMQRSGGIAAEIERRYGGGQ